MKKLVSFSLALVMMVASLFGFASVTFADEKTFVCGDNVNAVFNENTNTLTISGTGGMYNYTAFENPEWADPYTYTVETVIIEDGVTSIGDFSFTNMDITEVSLPSTLESIGKRAFSSCLRLKSITIPASVKSIGEYALRTANNSQASNLETINVEEGNQYFCSVDGVLYNKDKTELIQIPPCVKLTTLDLPDTVEVIYSYAGQKLQNITEIVIHDSINTVRDYAFDRAESLIKVIFETDKNVTVSINFLNQAKNAVIQGFAGSPIETFAAANSISFEPLPYCILTFVDNAGKETKVEADLNASPEEINAPALPQAVSLNSNQHMDYRWNPTLETVTKNATYTVEGFQENHTMVDIPDTAEKATIDHPGKYADSECEDCGYYVEGGEIPQLDHYTITATAENGTAKVEGVSDLGNVEPNGEITLVATPAAEGLEFVGWSLNDKIVSTEETYTTVAIANADYVAIYKEAETEFTVVFTDQYGNVYGTWTGTDASEIDIPAAPTLVGFTFKGWSMEEDAIKALEESTTIYAIFERTVADAKFNVTVEGDCTINGTEEKTLAVDYNTQVTVNAPEGATNGTWKVVGENGATAVAYGTSYTFFVGADITLTFEEDALVTAEPTVASVSMDKDPDSFKVAFLATRSVVDGYKYVSAGFVYGKNMTKDDLSLDNVGKKGSNGDSGNVKVLYCSTGSEQFRLSYGITAQTGSASVKPFLAYMDAEGETSVIYGTTQTYTY